jgi:hypothetical protein
MGGLNLRPATNRHPSHHEHRLSAALELKSISSLTSAKTSCFSRWEKLREAFMSSRKTSGLLLLIPWLLVWPGQSSLIGAQEPTDAKPKLYDTAADGKQQIADALKIAKTESKRIILKFGANW